jgi:predicted nucleic acid-binding protein
MFLDTSGLLCFHHRAEPQHTDAVRLFRSAPRRLTHNYVVAACLTLSGSLQASIRLNDCLQITDVGLAKVDCPLLLAQNYPQALAFQVGEHVPHRIR